MLCSYVDGPEYTLLMALEIVALAISPNNFWKSLVLCINTHPEQVLLNHLINIIMKTKLCLVKDCFFHKSWNGMTWKCKLMPPTTLSSLR